MMKSSGTSTTSLPSSTPNKTINQSLLAINPHKFLKKASSSSHNHVSYHYKHHMYGSLEEILITWRLLIGVALQSRSKYQQKKRQEQDPSTIPARCPTRGVFLFNSLRMDYIKRIMGLFQPIYTNTTCTESARHCTWTNPRSQHFHMTILLLRLRTNLPFPHHTSTKLSTNFQGESCIINISSKSRVSFSQ